MQFNLTQAVTVTSICMMLLNIIAVPVLICCLAEVILGYHSSPMKQSILGPMNGRHMSRTTSLYDIPLELSGRLDASRSWDVKFIFNGQEKIVSVPEDSSILEMGETIFDGVDSSCRNGVCTTCAGQVSCISIQLKSNYNNYYSTSFIKVIEGRDNALLAVHGLGIFANSLKNKAIITVTHFLGKPQLEAGFVCTCQCYVTGPGVTVKLGKMIGCPPP